ncbi:MAG: hypothetical protein Fur0018_21530 [Anaerolineales bacterium]
MPPETISLPMSLMDMLVPLIFLSGVSFLVRLARTKGNSVSAWMLGGGGTLAFLGGFMMATWKVFIALHVTTQAVRFERQFLLLAPGFLLLFLGAMRLTRSEAFTPQAAAVAAWKAPFLAVTAISSIGMNGFLTRYAFQRKQRLAGWMFILVVVFMLILAGMSGGTQSIAKQWVEQSLNLLEQSLFAIGSYLLYREAAE